MYTNEYLRSSIVIEHCFVLLLTNLHGHWRNRLVLRKCLSSSIILSTHLECIWLQNIFKFHRGCAYMYCQVCGSKSSTGLISTMSAVSTGVWVSGGVGCHVIYLLFDRAAAVLFINHRHPARTVNTMINGLCWEVRGQWAHAAPSRTSPRPASANMQWIPLLNYNQIKTAELVEPLWKKTASSKKCRGYYTSHLLLKCSCNDVMIG